MVHGQTGAGCQPVPDANCRQRCGARCSSRGSVRAVLGGGCPDRGDDPDDRVGFALDLHNFGSSGHDHHVDHRLDDNVEYHHDSGCPAGTDAR